ncbi:acetyl-CoA synthetase-like protein [Macrolepiota fuliginosa MF-IS2]|uniref:Acetyl-CoA synthetase-like protein n=1 Tax=Macrolepiota fuliginosa MF-IS2 TaxID=1400762 RepID=A0A9P5XA76_9AGAR|nr:acetyl-CoA synthetase-like protein [Macrolepiota fuliginosa MF-IS2]
MADLYTGNDLQLPHIPDNLSIAQFMLDHQHEIRPRLDDDMPCLIDSKTKRTSSLSQLRQSTYGLANALASNYGIGEDDKVMIMSPNHIDYPMVAWAIHRLGGIVTFSNPQFTVDELCHQLRTANVTFMVVHSTVFNISLEAARLCGLPDDRIVLLDRPGGAHVTIPSNPLAHETVQGLVSKGLDQPCCFVERSLKPGEGKTKVALLSWSSGTTGTPKAVAISHYGMIANVIQMALHHRVNGKCDSRGSYFRPGDTALGVLPFYHVAGFMISIHFVIFCSMTLVVLPKYDFLDMLDNFVRHRVSHLLLVPPQATTLSKYPHIHQHDLGSLKSLMIGAAPLSQQVQEKLGTLFPSVKIGQVYGMTEMTTVVAMLSADQQRGPLGSGGRLLPGVEVRVVRPDGTLAEAGELGELFVRGPAAALGYWNNAAATNETFVNGWVRTGDQVVLGANREVFVNDRLKEFLKVKGFQVAPAELEGALLGHPDVVDCCVIGLEDEYRGEIPLAYVVPSPSARESMSRDPQAASRIRESIQKYIAERKVRYKHLDGGVRFIETMPRNGSGKLLRRVLRQRVRGEGLQNNQLVYHSKL